MNDGDGAERYRAVGYVYGYVRVGGRCDGVVWRVVLSGASGVSLLHRVGPSASPRVGSCRGRRVRHGFGLQVYGREGEGEGEAKRPVVAGTSFGLRTRFGAGF